MLLAGYDIVMRFSVQLDLFPESLRLTPAKTLEARMIDAYRNWFVDPSMSNLALLKHVVDQRIALEHGTPRW